LRNLYAAAPDLYAGFTRGGQVGCVHVVVVQRRANEPARTSRRQAIATTFVRGVWARVAAPRPDAHLVAGEHPLNDDVLACRSGRPVSRRWRRRLASGLDRRLSPTPGDALLSAAVAVDKHAVDVARPALQQLASALRSLADVEPRGVAMTQVLLTEPCRPLHRPAYGEELYEPARAALFGLGEREAPRR
jgi:hypothetical protein